jgi:hypothetical protein
MSAIKTNILRRMDSAPPGVRVCCVKFLQQVVLVQTPGVVDPRVSITILKDRRYDLTHHSGLITATSPSPLHPAIILSYHT